MSSATLLGMAAIIIALSAGYYLFKRAWSEDGETEKRHQSVSQGDDKAGLPSLAHWQAWMAESEELATDIQEHRQGEPIDVDALWQAARADLEARDDQVIGR